MEELRAGRDDGWGDYLFFDDDGALVGFEVGRGPPIDGVAELGYAVASARRGRGIATGAVEELRARARESGVRLVVAPILPEESPSTRVLTRAGFARVGVVADPDGGVAGIVWRLELPLVGRSVDNIRHPGAAPLMGGKDRQNHL